MRLNRDPSVSSHRFKDPAALAEATKVVSASPFRATIKVDVDRGMENSSDDEFERDTMSHKDRSQRESPIKDDSELLRTQRSNFLGQFTRQAHG